MFIQNSFGWEFLITILTNMKVVFFMNCDLSYRVINLINYKKQNFARKIFCLFVFKVNRRIFIAEIISLKEKE